MMVRYSKFAEGMQLANWMQEKTVLLQVYQTRAQNADDPEQ
jgi:hypothetical protein